MPLQLFALDTRRSLTDRLKKERNKRSNSANEKLHSIQATGNDSGDGINRLSMNDENDVCDTVYTTVDRTTDENMLENRIQNFFLQSVTELIGLHIDYIGFNRTEMYSPQGNGYD